MRKTLRTITFAVLLGSSPLVAASDGQLSLTVGSRSITASGVSPGSTVIFFGVTHVRAPGTYVDEVQRWITAIDDSGHQGVVTWDFGQPVPVISTWAAVDLRNGHYALSSGSLFNLRVVTPSTNPLRKGLGGSVDTFAFDEPYLDLLYVHPGLGAWTWNAVDGSPSDADGANGSAVVKLSSGKPVIANAQRPDAFIPGGLLIAIDTIRLRVAVTKLDGQTIGGAL